MNKTTLKKYLAARRRVARTLNSIQHQKDLQTIKEAESFKGLAKKHMIVNEDGVAFRDIPAEVISCVTIDRKLLFNWGECRAEASWRNAPAKPPTGSFAVSIPLLG